jgi:hypothetical protein
MGFCAHLSTCLHALQLGGSLQLLVVTEITKSNLEQDTKNGAIARSLSGLLSCEDVLYLAWNVSSCCAQAWLCSMAQA